MKRSKKRSATSARSRHRRTDLTYFVDRSLGRGIVRALRRAGVRVKAHDDCFPQDAPDEKWISAVSRDRWVILTKDKEIRYNTLGRQAVLTAQARVFSLTSGNMTGAEMVEAFIYALPHMDRVAEKNSGPFFAYVTGSGHISRVLGIGELRAKRKR